MTRPARRAAPPLARMWRRAVLRVAGIGAALLAVEHDRYPSLIRDSVTGAYDTAARLSYPFWYVFFTPFTATADALGLVSLSQAKAAGVWLLAFVGFLLWRRRWIGAAAVVSFVAFAALVPRPVPALSVPDPDVVLVDFHSHTSLSHDGRRSFDAAANLRWHARQGFDAAFITDHNRAEAALAAQDGAKEDRAPSDVRPLVGEEVSLERTHLVVLGNKTSIDHHPFDSDPAKIAPFIRAAHDQGMVVEAALPETWLYHLPGEPGYRRGGERGEPLGTLEDLARWGVDGFEITNGSPRALDRPAAAARALESVCARYGLFLVGGTDNHGYGGATPVWTALRLPGWRRMTPIELQDGLLRTLRSHAPGDIRVLERVRYQPGSGWGVAIAPFGILWVCARGLTPAQACSWFLWILAFTFAPLFWRLRRRAAVPKTAPSAPLAGRDWKTNLRS